MSSDSGDEDNLPSAEECDKRCQEFADITGTNKTLGWFFLQDRDWDVARCINAFYEQGGADALGKAAAPAGAMNTVKTEAAATAKRETSTPAQGEPSVIPVEDSSDDDTVLLRPQWLGGKPKGKTLKPKAVGEGEAQTKSEEGKKASNESSADSEAHRIRLISWNIDGLDQEALQSRTKAVCDTINKENPDVVYLQEVIPESLRILEENCPVYQIVPGDSTDYFTAIMLKVSSVVYKDHNVLDFPNSVMCRNLLTVQACVKGVDMQLMTSHLESTAEHAVERVRQLRVAMKKLQEAAPEDTVVFGGDLNMRDKEVAEIGGLPDGVYDLWEVTGKRPECRYTWDMSRNDNLDTGTWKFKPKCRFDRLYMRHPAASLVLKPVYLELIGLERIPSCRRFPSDHWGMLAHFDIISVMKKLAKKL